jgi:hypothetical protein
MPHQLSDSIPALPHCLPLSPLLSDCSFRFSLLPDILHPVGIQKGKDAHELLKMLYAWKEQADKLSYEEISKEEYDNWRYHYPKFDTTQRWAKVPSQELSDALVEMFKDQLKPDK